MFNSNDFMNLKGWPFSRKNRNGGKNMTKKKNNYLEPYVSNLLASMQNMPCRVQLGLIPIPTQSLEITV